MRWVPKQDKPALALLTLSGLLLTVWTITAYLGMAELNTSSAKARQLRQEQHQYQLFQHSFPRIVTADHSGALLGIQKQNTKNALFPHRVPVQPARGYQVHDVIDGFENPNQLPKLFKLDADEFNLILAPAYYGKSPMDGSRNYELGSDARAEHCRTRHHHTMPHPLPRDRNFSLRTELCTFGPELVYNAFDDIFAAHLMHEVCLSFNIDSKKQVQRGLIVFDPQNTHKMRCVPCPNPVEFMRWGKHPCGLMWNHQINARSLADFSDCVEENKEFVGEIGQRQTPVGEELVGGTMHSGAVLELSFARGNPGHQSFDSLLTLLPILFPLKEETPFRVIVHQSPTCPDSEWICGLLRQIGFFHDHPLVEVNPSRMACFENLIVPKWGMARESRIPTHYLHELRNRLHAKFDFPPLQPLRRNGLEAGKTLLLYAHKTVSLETMQRRRTWEQMSLFANHSSIQAEFASVQYVHDFAALPIAKQGEAFYRANVIAMPHGGQMGNILFAREGSIVIEAACYPYSHFGMTFSSEEELFGTLPKALGIIHIVLVPCDCDQHRQIDSNFRLGPQSLLRILNMVRDYKPGTHIFGRRHVESEEDETEEEQEEQARRSYSRQTRLLWEC